MSAFMYLKYDRVTSMLRNPGDDDIIEMKRRGEEIKEKIIRNSYKNGIEYKT